MSRKAHGMMMNNQIPTPTTHGMMPTTVPTIIGGSGISSATVQETRPTGPNVVVVLRQRVLTVGGAGRANTCWRLPDMIENSLAGPAAEGPAAGMTGAETGV
jgi:hypothetical protein